MPGGYIIIAIINGAFQIQHLPPTFSLLVRNHCFPMKLFFVYIGIQESQKRNLILFTIRCPIQRHVGRHPPYPRPHRPDPEQQHFQTNQNLPATFEIGSDYSPLGPQPY